MSFIEELGLILAVGLVAPSVLVYSIMTIPKFINTWEGIGHLIIQTLGTSTLFFLVGWPAVFFNKWNDTQYDSWGFFIGILYIAVPAAVIFRVFWWSEKASEANRIARYLNLEVWAFINKEWEEIGGSRDDIFPLENSKFKVIHTKKGVSWYAKDYDVWFLQKNWTFFCDSDQNILGRIDSDYDFNLKKYLSEDRELQFNKKYD